MKHNLASSMKCKTCDCLFDTVMHKITKCKEAESVWRWIVNTLKNKLQIDLDKYKNVYKMLEITLNNKADENLVKWFIFCGIYWNLEKKGNLDSFLNCLRFNRLKLVTKGINKKIFCF